MPKLNPKDVANMIRQTPGLTDEMLKEMREQFEESIKVVDEILEERKAQEMAEFKKKK